MYVRTYHARRSIMRDWRNILVSFCQNYYLLLSPAFLCSVNDSFSRNRTSLVLTIYNQDTIPGLQFSCHIINMAIGTEWRCKRYWMITSSCISEPVICSVYRPQGTSMDTARWWAMLTACGRKPGKQAPKDGSQTHGGSLWKGKREWGRKDRISC